ncbi:MAG: PH domain-containing protein [Steroidobacteraceae bacterium]
MTTETEAWSGTSSQIVNLGTFILCGLVSLTVVGAVIAIPWAIWKYLVVKNQVFEVTSQRIKVHSGVLSKKTEELELYRVKDTKFEQPFFLRLFGLGNVVIVSTDASTPISMIPAIKDARTVREQLRTFVEERRDEKRVRVAELE